MLCCAVLHHAVLCNAALCCAVLHHAVLCNAACAVLCCTCIPAKITTRGLDVGAVPQLSTINTSLYPPDIVFGTAN